MLLQLQLQLSIMLLVLQSQSLNIANSKQSSHTPGGSHKRPKQFYFFEKKEKWTNKGTDKQYVADSLRHRTTCHI